MKHVACLNPLSIFLCDFLPLGDRDFNPPITRLLEYRCQVQLWSWSHALADVYQQKARAQPLFSLRLLEMDDLFKIGFIAKRSTVPFHQIDRSKAIVFKSVQPYLLDEVLAIVESLPQTQHFYHEKEVSGGLLDIIFEFSNRSADWALESLEENVEAHEFTIRAFAADAAPSFSNVVKYEQLEKKHIPSPSASPRAPPGSIPLPGKFSTSSSSSAPKAGASSGKVSSQGEPQRTGDGWNVVGGPSKGLIKTQVPHCPLFQFLILCGSHIVTSGVRAALGRIGAPKVHTVRMATKSMRGKCFASIRPALMAMVMDFPHGN